MNRQLFLALAVTAIAVLVVGVLTLQNYRASTVVLGGSLFVSDAGRSHGGFEYNAERDATLTVDGTSGTLKLVLNIGLGDALTKHEYSITEFKMEPNKTRMRIDGQPLTLVWVENDTIWSHTYDGYYTASWGGDAPPEEIRGNISPQIFPGLADHYYVELRLK
jgi:hypothetical protein